MGKTGFDEWVSGAAPALYRSAFLLVGDWALAQDLVQHGCAAVWRKWEEVDAPNAYARAVMARTATAWWRRKWHTEVPTEHLPDAAEEDQYVHVERRERVQQALAALPAKQRAVLVLRFFDDLTEADTAAALGWPVGTVKSTTARALQALRNNGIDATWELST